jgi:hypothetical protein
MTVQKINEVSSSVYGAGILAIDATAALWVVERILKDTGVNVYRTMSRYRHKYGMGTAFPEFGSAVFASM